ncbi:TetR/AcrR family transcriptional regulator [Angustibacter luteus]|uniref:TetR/AcrR family transcriptional regulator n=1 Tax=Angustibacter luteus TaxID=658456 RepID=A0ABW1JCR1_9ACTN
MATTDAALGLRERKNAQTRRAIVQSAAELTIEGGYAAATIPRIAERADVAPRTVSTWFPAKDDILFLGIDEAIARATWHLRQGPGDVVDRIEAWIADESGREQPDPEIARLCDAAITHDAELRARTHQRLEQVQSEIAEAVARDLGVAAHDVGPQTFAGATVSLLFALRAIGLEAPDDGTAQLAVGFRFLRAGLGALTGTSDR